LRGKSKLPRLVKIPLTPQKPLIYLVDSNFFANKYLESNNGENQVDTDRIENSRNWWQIIDFQIKEEKAIVFITDLCISETFKIIAKKYYQAKKISSPKYQRIRKKITEDLHLSISHLISANRKIKYHNLQADRDIIVGASRFLEIAHKNNLDSISVIDLVILSSAKYLIDFYKISKEQIIIISGDQKLIKCSKKAPDIPTVIDALNPKNTPEKYYEN